jgi:hypothetical protein
LLENYGFRVRVIDRHPHIFAEQTSLKRSSRKL